MNIWMAIIFTLKCLVMTQYPLFCTLSYINNKLCYSKPCIQYMLYIWLFQSCQAHRLREVTKTEGKHPFHLKGQYSLLAADWSSPGTPHKAYPNGLAAASTCQPEICTSVLCDSNSWSYYTPQQCSCPITATQPCPAVITPPPLHTHIRW